MLSGTEMAVSCTEIYIPLCLYLYCNRQMQLLFFLIYIPLCLYLYLGNLCTLQGIFTFTFHYVYIYMIWCSACDVGTRIYIPLCLYLYAKDKEMFLNYFKFTFHYVYIYIVIARCNFYSF